MPSEIMQDWSSERDNGELIRVALYKILLLSFAHESPIDVEYCAVFHDLLWERVQTNC